jgi:hypothetical protein
VETDGLTICDTYEWNVMGVHSFPDPTLVYEKGVLRRGRKLRRLGGTAG